MVNNPSRINRFIADYLGVNRSRFLLDVLFDNQGGMQGGAIIYEQQGLNDFYPVRDVQEVAPGATFPLITFQRQALGQASPRKWGGKFEVTYEARDRNNPRQLQRNTVQLANAIIRKNNLVALKVLDDAIAGLGGAAVITGNNWTTAVPPGYGASSTLPPLTPVADISEVFLINDQRELGIVFDTLVINPLDMQSLRLYYGKDADLRSAMSDYGIDRIFVTGQVAAGAPYAVAGNGQVGAYHVEQPLKTVSVEDELDEKFTIKSSVRPAMYVDNPYAVLRITGVRG
jgi:hypothetical protein